MRAVLAGYEADAELERVSLAGPSHLLPILAAAFPGARRIPHEGRGGEQAETWRGHDLALLFTGSFRSAWAAWRAGIPRRIGWARDGRGWLLTDSMRPSRERGRAPFTIGAIGRRPRYLPRPFGSTCVELVGLLGVRVSDTRPRLLVDPDARARVLDRLAKLGLASGVPFALINAGARPGSAKGYPAESFGAVAERIGSSADLPIVVIGGPGEEEAIGATAAAAGDVRTFALQDPVCDLAELAALAAEARVVVTSDSGPRHVAAAVGASLVCAVGPTDPRHSAEHLERTTLLREPLPCGPCHLERCPIAGEGHHACMRSIEPAAISEAALAWLAE